jgi:hypothetical protein
MWIARSCILLLTTAEGPGLSPVTASEVASPKLGWTGVCSCFQDLNARIIRFITRCTSRRCVKVRAAQESSLEHRRRHRGLQEPGTACSTQRPLHCAATTASKRSATQLHLCQCITRHPDKSGVPEGVVFLTQNNGRREFAAMLHAQTGSPSPSPA